MRKSEHDTNEALADSKQPPELHNERKPLVFNDQPTGNVNDSSTWELVI